MHAGRPGWAAVPDIPHWIRTGADRYRTDPHRPPAEQQLRLAEQARKPVLLWLPAQRALPLSVQVPVRAQVWAAASASAAASAAALAAASVAALARALARARVPVPVQVPAQVPVQV